MENLPTLARINVEYDIRSKSELRANVRNNAPITKVLTHDTTVFIIDGIKITDSVGEIIRKKTSYKELKSFLYVRGILYNNNFDLVDWTGF